MTGEANEISTDDDGTEVYEANRSERERRKVYSLVDDESDDESSDT